MWDTFPGRLYSSFEETTVSRCGTVTTRYRSCGLCSGIAALFDQTLMIAPQLCNAARTWDDVDTEQCDTPDEIFGSSPYLEDCDKRKNSSSVADFWAILSIFLAKLVVVISHQGEN